MIDPTTHPTIAHLTADSLREVLQATQNYIRGQHGPYMSSIARLRADVPGPDCPILRLHTMKRSDRAITAIATAHVRRVSATHVSDVTAYGSKNFSQVICASTMAAATATEKRLRAIHMEGLEWLVQFMTAPSTDARQPQFLARLESFALKFKEEM